MEYDITIKQEDGSLKEIPIHVDAVTSPTDDGTVKKVGQVRENNGALEYALDSAPTEWKAIGGGGDAKLLYKHSDVIGTVGTSYATSINTISADIFSKTKYIYADIDNGKGISQRIYFTTGFPISTNVVLLLSPSTLDVYFRIGRKDSTTMTFGRKASSEYKGEHPFNIYFYG